MNAIIFLGLVGIVVMVLMYFVDVEFMELLLLVVVVFTCYLLLVKVTIKDISYNSVESGLKLIVSDNMSSEQMKSEIENLIMESTDGKSFGIEVYIEDNNMDSLLVKNIKMEFKYPVLTKNIYLNNKEVFKMFIKKGESQKHNVEIIKTR